MTLLHGMPNDAKRTLTTVPLFFVLLRVLKGYSELTLGYSCLRDEIFPRVERA
jgi:hypothetical protein